jgi:hypothetical protein
MKLTMFDRALRLPLEEALCDYKKVGLHPTGDA